MPRGRPAGSPNKLPTHLKEMILAALEDRGGVSYLAEQAEKNPASFMSLLGKILPMQVTGENGDAIKTAVTVTFVKPQA